MVSWLDRLIFHVVGWTPPERTPMPKHPHDFITLGKTHLVIRHITGFAPGAGGLRDTLLVSTAGGPYQVADPEGEHYQTLVDTFTSMANDLNIDDLTAALRPGRIVSDDSQGFVPDPRSHHYAAALAHSDRMLIAAANSDEGNRKALIMEWMKFSHDRRVVQREIMFRNLEATGRRAMELLDEMSKLKGMAASERHEATRQLDELRAEMTRDREAGNEWMRRANDLTRENGSLTAELASTRERMRKAENMASTIADMTVRMKWLEDEQAKKDDAYAGVVRDLEAKVDALRGLLADRVDEIAELTEEKNNLFDSLQLVRGDLSRTRDEADSREVHLTAELAQARNDLASRTDEATELDARLTDLTEAYDVARASATKHSDEVAKLEQRVIELDEAVRERDSRIQDTAAQLLDVRAQLGRIRQIAEEKD